MKKTLILPIILTTLLITGCGQNANVADNANATAEAVAVDNSLISSYNLFTVTSDNLKNGQWDEIIASTDEGENHSPQLSWEPVEGATSYMVYMVDTSMLNWIHWKSCDITETTLPEGWADKSEYVGPWPPEGGSHTYEIYVLALKNPVERMKGSLNSQNPKFDAFIASADTDANGNTGNIAGAAHIVGTYTY